MQYMNTEKLWCQFQQCLHILSFHKGRNSKWPHSSMQRRRKFKPLLQRSHPCYVHVGKNVLCSSVYDGTDAHGILWICETPGGPTNHLSKHSFFHNWVLQTTATNLPPEKWFLSVPIIHISHNLIVGTLLHMFGRSIQKHTLLVQSPDHKEQA